MFINMFSRSNKLIERLSALDYEFAYFSVFLPRKLPDINKEIELKEHVFLRLINYGIEEICKDLETYKVTYGESTYDNILSNLISMFKKWFELQANEYIDEKKIKEGIDSLKEKQSFPLYLRGQNACIIISIPLKNAKYQAIVSSFQVSPFNEQLMGTSDDLAGVYPSISVNIKNLEILHSQSFADQLSDLGNFFNETTFAKAKKAGVYNEEVRDVPSPSFITEWISPLLAGEFGKASEIKPIIKKIRDDVFLKDALLPFRRSGMWICVKAVLQWKLTEILGETEGKFIYKVIILNIVLIVCENNTKCPDQQFQMMQKIAKRVYKLNKIEGSDKIKQFMAAKAEGVVSKTNQNIYKDYVEVIENSRKLKSALNWSDVKCEDKIHKLNELFSSINQFTKMQGRLIMVDGPPRGYFIRNLLENYEFNLNILDSSDISRLGLHLYDIERWVEISLKFNGFYRPESLLEILSAYLNKATEYYKKDPVGNSRMILTVIKIVCVLDQIACQQYPILKMHHIGFDTQIFEWLLLPKATDITYAYLLIDYIQKRNNKSSYLSLIDPDIKNRDSFAQKYAENYDEINTIKKKLLSVMEQQIKEKYIEIKKARKEYEKYKIQIENSLCNYIEKIIGFPEHCENCHKCYLIRSSKRIKVEVYEYILPEPDILRNAIIFELVIPLSISTLRDSLHILKTEILGFVSEKNKNLSGVWIDYESIKNFAKKNEKLVTIGYVSRSFKETHYCYLSIENNSSDENFFVPNGRDLHFSNFHQVVDYKKKINNKNLCTFKTSGRYADLQWTLSTTSHSENEVIAEQHKCPKDMLKVEYLKFCTFRIGNRLQLFNLLDAIENRMLLFKHYSVYSLIAQSLWELGPIPSEVIKQTFQYPISHTDFSNIEYIEQLYISLSDLLDSIENNWNDNVTLLNIIIIALRAISMSIHEGYRNFFIQLLLRCRELSLIWQEKISGVVINCQGTNETEYIRLKEKLMEVCCFTIITYNVDRHLISCILNNGQDIIDYFSSLIKIYEHNAFYSEIESTFKKNLLRMIDIITIELEDSIKSVLYQDQGNCIKTIIREKWSEGNQGVIYDINKMNENYFITAKFNIPEEKTKVIQIGLDGSFLVDNQPIGKLSKEICSHSEFRRLFGETDFDVHPSTTRADTYCTSQLKISYKKYCSYTFHLNKGHLIITERVYDESIKKEYILIPKHLLQVYFPESLISDYSHWVDPIKQKILFRPTKFSDPEYHSKISFEINVKTCEVKETSTERYLIDINSSTFNQIYNNILFRLELGKHVHMFTKDNIIEIDLPRLGLNFQLDNETKEFISREFRGMKISKDQRIYTLFGLEQGIVLSDIANTLPKKKFLVPHGKIKINGSKYSRTVDFSSVKINESKYHQTIDIDFINLKKPSYFVYDIDTRLKCLRAGESITAWLYLAWMHGATSHVLPDPFTSINGTSMALELLQSGHCWSCKPLEEEALFILKEISNLSPKRSFFHDKMEVMQQVDWPEGLLPMTAHESYTYLVLKIFNDSNRLEFAFDKETKPVLDLNVSDRINMLANKAYYRNYYGNLKLDPELEFIMGKKPGVTMIPEVNFSWNKNHVQNVRILAGNKYALSFDYDLKEKFSSLESFENRAENTFSYKFVSEWFPIPEQFTNWWTTLYYLCVTAIDSEDFIKLRILLSFLAYMEISIDDLIFLQSILYNRKKFKYIELPSIPKYENLSLFQYSTKIITHILKEASISLDKYATEFYKVNFQACDPPIKVKIKELYLTNQDSEVKSMERFIRAQWPDSQLKELENQFFNTLEVICKVNKMFKMWSDNNCFHEFLDQVLIAFSSLNLKYNEKKIAVVVEESEFVYKSSGSLIKFHFDLKSTDKTILDQATDIFTNSFTADAFNSKKELNIIQNPKKIPNFPFETKSTDCQITTKYFKFLRSSWESYHGKTLKPNPISQYSDINEALKKSIKIHSNKIKEFQKTIEETFNPTNSFEKIYKISALWPTLTPSVMLSLLLRKKFRDLEITENVRELLGALAVLWTLEQRVLRCVVYAEAGDSQVSALQKELESVPYENWKPREYPEWLVLEIELDMMIRGIQYEVAKNMISPQKKRNTVMQLNMGEGKTSLIIPMLAICMANQTNLVRITVLKSLFNINYNALVQKLGGILNRKVYVFPCRRDKKFELDHVSVIDQTLIECKDHRGVVLSLPEYRLSFTLKGIEACMKPKNSELARALLKTEKWLTDNTRDILDESDEILNVKFQLVYTIGSQSQVSGGSLRWQVSQAILGVAKNHFEYLKRTYGDECIQYERNKDHLMAFPKFRLLKYDAYAELCDRICYDIFKGKATEINFLELKEANIEIVKKFVLDPIVSDDIRSKVNSLFPEHSQASQILLVLRGLLSYEILYAVLKKRWRVDFGVNLINKYLLQAVPFKAKDVPAERAQFAHPDIAILSTQISYYYSGLANEYLDNIFEYLENESNGAKVYENWIQSLPKECKPDKSILEYSGLNFCDTYQKNYLVYPLLRYHPPVINYWLNAFVYPKEAKQFIGKLAMSAWDLCAENPQIMTGFSGTNDSKPLLPLTTMYYDIPELLGTNGYLITNLLLPENNNYIPLKVQAECIDILQTISKYDLNLRLILDVGALIIDFSNEKFIKEWLNLRKDMQAGIYFNDNDLMVVDRKGRTTPFEMSPYRRDLDSCLIYLDDAHTRGTDLKIPKGTIGAVTLGKGVTKDRLMQACMRMRMLGHGHKVCFFSSYEVHFAINKALRSSINTQDSESQIGALEVLKWAIGNSKEHIEEGFLYWGLQGLSYYKRQAAYQTYLKEKKIQRYAMLFGERDTTEIYKLYNGDRIENLVVDIIETRLENYKKYLIKSNAVIGNFYESAQKILGRCSGNIKEVTRKAQLYEEERELELELELEIEQEQKREVYVPVVAKSESHGIDPHIVNFVKDGKFIKYPNSYIPLPNSLEKTSIQRLIQPQAWDQSIYVSRDFNKTVKSIAKGEDYLKPIRWLCYLDKGQESVLLVVSSYEASHLMSIPNPKVSFFMYLPRVRLSQIQVFPCKSNYMRDCLPQFLVQQISVFSGSLYIQNHEELEAYLDFIGYCPNPRTPTQQHWFENNFINQNGYVKHEYRKIVFGENKKLSRFIEDPAEMICKLTEIKNYGIVSKFAHHLEILLSGRKPKIFYEIQ